MVFSYLWGIFQGVNYRGRVIVAHARLWIQGSKQRNAGCAANHVFRARALCCKSYFLESHFLRIIFVFLLITKKTVIHNLWTDGPGRISLLSFPFLLTLTFLMSYSWQLSSGMCTSQTVGLLHFSHETLEWKRSQSHVSFPPSFLTRT